MNKKLIALLSFSMLSLQITQKLTASCPDDIKKRSMQSNNQPTQISRYSDSPDLSMQLGAEPFWNHPWNVNTFHFAQRVALEISSQSSITVTELRRLQELDTQAYCPPTPDEWAALAKQLTTPHRQNHSDLPLYNSSANFTPSLHMVTEEIDHTIFVPHELESIKIARVIMAKRLSAPDEIE